MLPALKLTFSLSIWLASSLALSSQRSARAGETENAATSASAATRKIGRRSGRRDVMCECPFGRIEAWEDARRKEGVSPVRAMVCCSYDERASESDP